MKLNLPNRLTLSRILVVPLVLFFLLPLPDAIFELQCFGWIKADLLRFNSFIANYGNYIAAGIFILAASTDGLDGYIARKRKQVTRFGKFLDPIADKLLVTAALIALVQRDEVTAWSATIIISREFIVTGLRLVASADGMVIAASKWGKIKTVTQMIAIITTLIKDYSIRFIWDFPLHRVAMTVAVICTLYSGYEYIAKNRHIIDTEK